MDPADIEYILQESATWTEENNVDGNYSQASGHGRLNAYQALKMIGLPKLQIVHPDTLPISQQLIEQNAIDVRLASPLSQNAGGPVGSQFPLAQNTDYRVVQYKYQLQYDFSQYMQPSTTLLDAWVRHSQTNSFRILTDTTWTIDTVTSLSNIVTYEDKLVIDTIGVEPMCVIDSISNDSIIYLSGYYYNFIEEYDLPLDVIGASPDTMDIWYPMNPNIEQPKMAFSIYISDDSLNTQYDFPCYADNNLIDSFAQIYESGEELTFDIFPNPGTNQISIRLPVRSKGKILLHDVFGRLINEMNTSQGTLYFIDTGAMSRGIYFVTYITGDGQSSKKWIKQ